MDAPLFAVGTVTNREYRDHRIFVEPDTEGRGFHVSELWYEAGKSSCQEESEWLPGAKLLDWHLQRIGHEIEWQVFTNELLRPLLIFQEQSLHTQVVRRDRDKLEVLLAPGFAEVGASGTMYNREQIITLLVGSESSDELHSENFEFKRLGAGTAMLLYRTWHLAENGERVHEAMRSSIWSCSLGQWSMVFHQGTLCRGREDAT
jgi:hypothetical protein